MDQHHRLSGSPCQGGSDIFAVITENSPMGHFIANTNLTAEAGSHGLRLCLEGPNVHWMFLDGPTIRLNTSKTRVLDREVQGSLLIAQLICRDNVVQRHYRIQIQILNVNDNKPEFSQGSTKVIAISENITLEFSPGPIKAEDGDRGLDTPLKYSILSGSDHDRFVINNSTGQITLTRAVDDRTQTPFFRLSVMATQLNDPLKYSIASVLIRVLVMNSFPPVFNQSTYRGFVVQSTSPATIVSTFGNQVLLIQVSDLDFPDGMNPNVQYSLYSPSVTEGLYHITQGGVLIARTDRLYAFDRHVIQVIARDEESGEEVSASVDIEVLQRGQAVPPGKFTEEQFVRAIETHLTEVISVTILLVLLSASLFVLLRLIRRKHSRQKLEGEAKADRPLTEVTSRPVLSGEPSRSGSLHGHHGLYTRKQSILPSATSTSTEGTNNGSRNTIQKTERSEGSIDPVTLSQRAKGADRSVPQEHSTLGSTQGTNVPSHSTTRQPINPCSTTVTAICLASEDGQ
ncbi:protocadherin-11 Y-linked isoform X2 [Eucyclogobius newberryi]|uniref:protocadherin-11 Y-linked isoform X2 n=1 Tax=Eucyclogobius newberryi TaxID=166745 RepID=UPI003B59B975